MVSLFTLSCCRSCETFIFSSFCILCTLLPKCVQVSVSDGLSFLDNNFYQLPTNETLYFKVVQHVHLQLRVVFTFF